MLNTPNQAVLFCARDNTEYNTCNFNNYILITTLHAISIIIYIVIIPLHAIQYVCKSLIYSLDES